MLVSQHSTLSLMQPTQVKLPKLAQPLDLLSSNSLMLLGVETAVKPLMIVPCVMVLLLVLHN